MLETVVTYFLDNFPWIAAICVTGYLSWKAAVYYTKVEDARKKVDSLPCDKRKEEIDLVIAILARDRYFSEHNILVEDVDKHDPLNKI